MKKRNLPQLFILNIVTLGMYYPYWLYSTRKEMLARGVSSIPRVFILFIPPLLMLASLALYGAVVSSTGTTDSTASLPGTLLLIFFTLSLLSWPVVAAWWMYRFASAVATTTKRFSHDFTFWMWVAAAFFSAPVVWLLMVQNEFNHLAAKKHSTR